MKRVDLILLHPPSIYRFRERPVFHGPISDVIPSSSVFENYPIGFLTLSEYLNRRGVSVRIVNLALKMLKDPSFDPDGFIARLDPTAFGIDLHWLPHVDGSLSLAESVKRYHPRTPVIFGGLSATYYHRELMHDHPCVDFVVCGDSTEEPLRLLMEAIRNGGDFGTVPNLVWRDRTGETMVNGISWRPTSLDYVSFDYAHPVKMTMKYHDPTGYLPFSNWLANPVMAAFTCRGCRHDCASCGGSASAFRRIGGRERPVFRSPELLARDVRDIARYTGAPVMVVGDLLQGGEEYAGTFLREMQKHRVENELAVEFFHPPPPAFVAQVADSLANFNVEISPESHDPRVRRAFGKAYGNAELEASVEAFVRSSCRRLDLFFMVGLPYQDYTSVMATVEYCGELLRRYGATGKLLPMIAPLAPFVDPGSRIFEEPERFGYRLFCRTLRQHRQAMLKPTWKERLNYETEWLTRDEIVQATYDAALRLVELKAEHGLLGTREALAIGRHIRMARELIRRIEEAPELDATLREEIARVNRLDFLCDKHELEWPVKGLKLHLFNLFRQFLQ